MTRRSLPILLLAGSLLLLAVPLLAQPPGGGPGAGLGGGPFAGSRAHGRPGERLAEFLDLTADQRVQWDALHQELRDSLRPLFEEQRTLAEELRGLLEQSSPDAAAVGSVVIRQHDNRQTMQAAHEDLEEQLKAILTPEQLDRFEAFKAARPFGHRGSRRGGPGFGGRR